MNHYAIMNGRFGLYDQKLMLIDVGVHHFFGLIMLITFLPSLQHANGEKAWTGIDRNSGVTAYMKELKVQKFSFFG